MLNRGEGAVGRGNGGRLRAWTVSWPVWALAGWCLAVMPMVPGARGAALEGGGTLEASVVTLEVTFKNYDFFQPWNKPTRAVRKHALVLGERELITTAQNLADRTLVRAQKGGRGRWFPAEVTWLDYHANVAVVTVSGEGFWEGLTAVPLSDEVPRQSQYEIVRWRDGNLETRRADFSKFTVGEGAMSASPRMHLELNTEIGGLGWAEPVLAGGRVVGLTVAKGGNVCSVMPAPFVRRVLAAREGGRFPGLGYFDFVWQPGENPATLDYLRVEGEPRGAVVIEIPKDAGADYGLRRFDVLVEIDGFAVDIQGDYLDPEYGHLMIEGLATRRHFAGDRMRMKVLRGGRPVEVEYRIPLTDYANDLLPMHVFDQEPEYLVAGGLVFQPLHQPYLRGWGEDWRRRAPFRLVYFNNDSPTPERSSLVVMSQVLPDPINVGYQEFRNLVVEAINGRPVRTVADVQAALRDPRDGVHRVEFFRGDGLQRLLLDATALEESTGRVLQRYGIPAASVIDAGPAAGG
ncbi:MAG: hypothetical protein KF833_23410 [Verrucomicrobiae bacterium]|nr:hypothetical protein [Verrucomicrobiae bacterium]